MPSTTPLALIVEDHVDVAEMYATFLAQVGFRVVISASAADGFAKAVTERVDVVVVDVRLPDGPDGVVLTTKLRLDPRTHHLPIIVLTGDAYPEDRARALAAGCDVFLTKPCLPSVLAEHARMLVAA